jgi:hypothetical protein
MKGGRKGILRIPFYNQIVDSLNAKRKGIFMTSQKAQNGTTIVKKA